LSVNNELERVWIGILVNWGTIPNICLGILTQPQNTCPNSHLQVKIWTWDLPNTQQECYLLYHNVLTSYV